MKKVIIISALALTIGMNHACKVEAQAVSIHVNIDRQPAWGPAGYDYAAFYYFPELNIYFDVNRAQFYWQSNRKWVSDRYLPLSYRRYDLYGIYKVVLNHGPDPWIHNRLHRRDYARFRNNHSQVAIRHAKEQRYRRARNNTHAWVAPERSSHRNGHSDSHYQEDHRNQNREKTQAKPSSNQKRERTQAKSSSNQKRSTQSGRSSQPNTNKRP